MTREEIQAGAGELLKVVKALRDGYQWSDMATIIGTVSVIGGQIQQVPDGEIDEYLINLGTHFAAEVSWEFKPVTSNE